MPFTPKAWANGSGGGTKLNAAALIDLETRLSDYTDTQAAAAPVLAPAASSRNVIQPSADTASALVLQAHSTTQSAPVLTLERASGTKLFDFNRVTTGGDMVVYDSSGVQAAELTGGGQFKLGNPNNQPVMHIRGDSTYANTNGDNWQIGIDSANAPILNDFFIARGNAGGATVTDFFYIRNGQKQGNPSRLGIGLVPQDADNGTQSAVPGRLEVGTSSLTNGLLMTNIVARVRNSTSPVQTGYAMAVVNEGDTAVYSVDVSGTIALKQTGSNIGLKTFDTTHTNPLHDVLISGKHEWGPGTGAVDTNLYRNNVGQLKTDGQFRAVGDIYSDTGLSTQVIIGAAGANAGVSFGSASDVTLLRKASDFLVCNVGLGTGQTSAPASGSLSNSQMVFWLDPTPGAAKVMAKAKDSAGTVVTGTVATLA